MLRAARRRVSGRRPAPARRGTGRPAPSRCGRRAPPRGPARRRRGGGSARRALRPSARGGRGGGRRGCEAVGPGVGLRGSPLRPPPERPGELLGPAVPGRASQARPAGTLRKGRFGEGSWKAVAWLVGCWPAVPPGAESKAVVAQ